MKKLKEHITGNSAIVFHGSENDEVYRALCEGKWKNYSGVYGEGLYSVYNLNGNATSKGKYGTYILKLYIKDLSKYWCFDWDNFQKVHPIWAKHTNEEDFIDYQAEKFKLKKDIYPKKLGDLYEEYDYRSSFITSVDGIIYHGTQDGDCILSYNPYNCRPLAISDDNGETWEKIDEEYIQQYKQTLSNPKVNKSFYDEKKKCLEVIRILRMYCSKSYSKYGLDNNAFIIDMEPINVNFVTISQRISRYIETYNIKNISDIDINEIVSYLLDSFKLGHIIRAICDSKKLPQELKNILVINALLDSHSFYENCNKKDVYLDTNNTNLTVCYIYNVRLYIFAYNYDELFLFENEENESLYHLINDIFYLFIQDNHFTNDEIDEFFFKLKKKESDENIKLLFDNLNNEGLYSLYDEVIHNNYADINQFLSDLYRKDNKALHDSIYFNDFSHFSSLTQEEVDFVISNNISILDLIEVSNDEYRAFFETEFGHKYNSLYFEQIGKIIVLFTTHKLRFEISKKYIPDNHTDLFISGINSFIQAYLRVKGSINNQQFIKLQKLVGETIEYHPDADYVGIYTAIDLICIKNNIKLRSNFVLFLQNEISYIDIFNSIDDNFIFDSRQLMELCANSKNKPLNDLLKVDKRFNKTNLTLEEIVQIVGELYDDDKF